jgi:hypothetical protein
MGCRQLREIDLVEPEFVIAMKKWPEESLSVGPAEFREHLPYVVVPRAERSEADRADQRLDICDRQPPCLLSRRSTITGSASNSRAMRDELLPRLVVEDDVVDTSCGHDTVVPGRAACAVAFSW